MSLLLLALLACADPTSAPAPAEEAHVKEAPGEPSAPIDIDDPQSCAPCHQQVVSEWTESMHSRAHQNDDPIFAGMRAARMAKQGEEVARKCANCHNPRSPEDTSTPAAKAGVSCAACHNVASLKEGGHGATRMRWFTDNTLVATRELAPGVSPAHGTGHGAPHLIDGTSLCLSCHGAMANGKGAPTCTTGPEHEQVAEQGQSCVSCHMPEASGPSGSVSKADTHRSHVFAGPHRAWYQGDMSLLADAVTIRTTLHEGELMVELENKAVHAFPTGFPGRVAMIKAVGKDAEGEVLWSNVDQDPMKESPDSVLNKIYVDEEGKVTMPPFAASLKRDNRLKPGEIRRVTFEVPAEVMEVEVHLMYRLVPPPLVEKFKLGTEGQPKRVKSVVAKR